MWLQEILQEDVIEWRVGGAAGTSSRSCGGHRWSWRSCGWSCWNKYERGVGLVFGDEGREGGRGRWGGEMGRE